MITWVVVLDATGCGAGGVGVAEVDGVVGGVDEVVGEVDGVTDAIGGALGGAGEVAGGVVGSAGDGEVTRLACVPVPGSGSVEVAVDSAGEGLAAGVGSEVVGAVGVAGVAGVAGAVGVVGVVGVADDLQTAPCGSVPQPDGIIPAGTGQHAAIGVPRDAVYDPAMPTDPTMRRLPADVPLMYRAAALPDQK